MTPSGSPADPLAALLVERGWLIVRVDCEEATADIACVVPKSELDAAGLTVAARPSGAHVHYTNDPAGKVFHEHPYSDGHAQSYAEAHPATRPSGDEALRDNDLVRLAANRQMSDANRLTITLGELRAALRDSRS